MKKTASSFIMTMFVTMCVSYNTFAAVNVITEVPKVEQISDFTRTQIATLNKTQLEQQLCRRLTLKERFGIAIVKRQFKRNKQDKRNASVSPDVFAIASIILGILSFFIFNIPLAIGAIIFGGIGLGKKGKLRGAAILGIIIGVFRILVAIIFPDYST